MQELVNGLAQGSVYALTAMGLVLIFSVVRVPNFAHGESVMFGGMLTLVSASSLAIPLPLAILVGITAAMAFGWILSVGVFSRLRDKSEIGQLMVSLALVVMIGAAATLIWGDDPKIVPGAPSATLQIAGAFVPVMWLVIFVVAVLTAVGMEYFIRATTAGRVMRAMARKPDAARLMGIPVGWYQALAFVVGSALAGLGGGLYSLAFPVQASMGTLISLKAFVVIIFAGMGSITGALIGGLLLGLVESFGGSHISTGYTNTFGFVFLLVVLLLKPEGLFGGRSHA
jgi:branched-chain amino acid transport system permease protein